MKDESYLDSSDIQVNAIGVIPIFDLNNEHLSLRELASSLKLHTAQELPFRRVPVPLDVATYTRLSYICDKYGISFAQLISQLISITLPDLEKELGVNQSDVCKFFNDNPPKGYEQASAITSDELGKIAEALINETLEEGK